MHISESRVEKKHALNECDSKRVHACATTQHVYLITRYHVSQDINE